MIQMKIQRNGLQMVMLILHHYYERRIRLLLRMMHVLLSLISSVPMQVRVYLFVRSVCELNIQKVLTSCVFVISPFRIP